MKLIWNWNLLINIIKMYENVFENDGEKLWNVQKQIFQNFIILTWKNSYPAVINIIRKLFHTTFKFHY